MLPQGAVRTLEKQLNAALDTLPRSTLSMIESHFHNWVPGGGSGSGHDDAMHHTRLVEWGDDEFGGSTGSSNSNASSPSLVASTRRRSTLQEQRLTGTKYFSLDNQSFALTGVQGYHGTTSSSYTSDEDTSVSTPETENSTLPMVMLSGLCPDGMDYYRDTPIKDWIGDSALAGVARSAKEALPPPPTNMMQPNRKVDLMADLHDDHSQDVTLMEPTILSGVMVQKADYGIPSEKATMDDLHAMSPLSSFLRQHDEDSMTSSRLMDNDITFKSGLTGVRYDEASMNEEPVALSGLLRHDDTFTLSTDNVVEYTKQSTTTTTFEPVTLSGLRVDDVDGGTRSGFVEAPVDMLSHPKTPPEAMEPIALTGLLSSKDDGSSFFVQEPSSDLAFKKDKVIDLEPVKLSGLAANTIASEFTPFVQEPEQDVVFEKKREIDIEPVTLSGLRQEHESFIPFVQEPREDTTTKVVDIEPISLTGLRMDDDDGSFTPFVTEPANNNDTKIHVMDMEPVQLTGLRSDEAYSTFVQEPKVEPVSLSGLQSKDDVAMATTVVLTGLRENVGSASFVEEPAHYEPKASADDLLDPVDLPCLRTGLDTEYLGFVDVPSDYEPKAPVDVVPVTLSCLRTGSADATEHAAFVAEPLDYEPNTPPTNLDKVVMSCLRDNDDANYASFVESPLGLEKEPVDLDECAKPVPLSCLRADVGYADFVDEALANKIEKEPIDLDECAKPVPMHGLRSDAGYAEFVNAVGYERDVEPVTLEVPAFQCLRSKDSEYLGFVSEPQDYKKAMHVPLDPPSTAFLQSDMDNLGFVEAPATIEQKQYDMEVLGQQMDHLSLSGLSKEVGMETRRHGDDDEFKSPKEESADPILLSGLQHQGESIKESIMEILPTVQLPWEESEMPMMKFVPEEIALTGMSQQQQIEVPLKNWLNIGSLVGVTANKEMSLYEAPVEMPKEDVVEEVDLEQYRCAIPLSGVSDSELTTSLKNWLNMEALPGTLGSIVSIYESPATTMPDGYIQPSLDMDDGRSPMLGMITSDDKTLKNWLNMGALSGTVASGLLYEQPIDTKDEPPKLKKSELKQLRKPVPLPGIKNENVHLKNWLNTSALPGIRTTESSRFIYGNPGDDIPTDYIQVQEDMQQELTSLSGTIADIPKAPLKNWLSIGDLPGIQKDNTLIRLYEEAHELEPADYVEPTSLDMEGDIKLTGVVENEDTISEDDAARRSSMEDTMHSEDEHSITTSETSHGPVPPLFTSPKPKQQLSNEEWSAMKEIIEQKEE